jgi:2,4-dienoyl-CoA reductase-like NADH-dependent reductase (Old Yellow Enzyme family)
MSLLETAIRIGQRVAPNRIVNQPMEGNDADEQGNPTDVTLQRYRKLAEGGAGVIIVEALAISQESRARKNQLAIHPKTAGGLGNLIREMRRINSASLTLMQITHSGSQSQGDFSFHILTEKEIVGLEDAFTRAAVIAEQVGADGIDFKQCHGYLGGEILRPANLRPDRFGGSFENRTRFFRETAQKIKDAVGDSFLLGSRFSAYEGIPGGFGTGGAQEVIEDLTESLALAGAVEKAGFHYINVSAGIPSVTPEIVRPTRSYPEGVYRHFGWARAVKKVVKIPVIGSGYSYLRDGQNELKEADPGRKSFTYWTERNLSEGNCDLVGIGRQSLADPLFAQKILSGQASKINFCLACGSCSALLRAQAPTGCVVYFDFYKNLFRELRSSAPG